MTDSNTSNIIIDASKKLFQASIRLNGSSFEDLNFQCYGGMYSQLPHGQDFEEHIDVYCSNKLVAQTTKTRLTFKTEAGKKYLVLPR